MIYAIQVGDDGPIKFGVARHPPSRMRELQTGNPGKLVLRAQVDLPDWCERLAHQWLASHRLQGEWFAPSDDVKSVLRDLQARQYLTGDKLHPNQIEYKIISIKLFGLDAWYSQFDDWFENERFEKEGIDAASV